MVVFVVGDVDEGFGVIAAVIVLDLHEVEVVADLPLVAHGVAHVVQGLVVEGVLGDHVFLLLVKFVYLDHLQNDIIVLASTSSSVHRVLLLILALHIARTIRFKA